ncbi:alginate export family protein [Rhodopseudomonas palustris]|uniref:alginate export family protein n=1 Tax=Rhodopseudomonas palustris TaxID=1076 RepID=UPI0022F06CAA|nr:alginate export family protein [Rhodopseudomonas palustris]WBU31941.1 alginate export family protein [Rhodopseudomonas palustris]
MSATGGGRRGDRCATRVRSALLASVALIAFAGLARAADDAPARPAIQSNRWAEDWSVLADPKLQTEPFDSLKYVPLWVSDPKSYVSFGASLRERFEFNDAPAFGTGGNARDSYVIQRLQVHADVHFDANWRAFVQLEDDRAFDKLNVTLVDQDRVDLRLAFLEYTKQFSGGLLKARVGRQDFAFDLQRFVSSRDGPNVRQSFDAVWADWETGTWRFIGFVSRPVQYFDDRPFDDRSSDQFRFSTLRIERKVLGDNELSAYYSLYERAGARYLDATGDERRHIFDIRFAGKQGPLDWDLEAMGQTGQVGTSTARAWAVGARTGYTLPTTWQPRLGLQFDAASGDDRPNDGVVGTFNPLFPNGYYFTLAGFTGYANLVHLKPSITVSPANRLKLMAAVGLQWRATTADAIYVQPSVPVAGTAGVGSAWTGAYGQLRLDYAFDAHLTGAIEAVHFDVGDTIRTAGGRSSDYLGLQLQYGW